MKDRVGENRSHGGRAGGEEKTLNIAAIFMGSERHSLEEF